MDSLYTDSGESSLRLLVVGGNITGMDFFKKHPIASIVGVVGAAMTVGGIVLDGLEIVNAGWPGYVWAAIGATLFMSSMVAVVSSQHSQIAEMQNSTTQEQPEAQQPTERFIQTEAITDDNPNGTWERVGEPPPQPEPNYQVWGKRTKLRIDEAAMLMAGIHPDGSDKTPASRENQGLLIEATSKGKIARTDASELGLQLSAQNKEADDIIWEDIDFVTPISMVSLLKFLQDEGLALDFVEKVKPYVSG